MTSLTFIFIVYYYISKKNKKHPIFWKQIPYISIFVINFVL